MMYRRILAMKSKIVLDGLIFDYLINLYVRSNYEILKRNICSSRP
jgi:hypothetical protein